MFKYWEETSLDVYFLGTFLSVDDISSVGNPTCATHCKPAWVRVQPALNISLKTLKKKFC